MNIRIEHIRHSGCRQEFLDRVKRNTAASADAKKSGGMAISMTLYHRTRLICWFRACCPQAGASITPYQPHRLDGGQHSSDDCPCSLRDHHLILYRYCMHAIKPHKILVEAVAMHEPASWQMFTLFTFFIPHFFA